MSAGFLKILNISISAGWLVAVVVLLRFILRKAPKWARCMLWGVVALRLLLPFSLESSLSLLPSAESIRTETVAAEQTDVHARPVISERVVLSSGIKLFDDAVNPVMEKTAEEMAETGTKPIVSVGTLGWIWAVGACAMLMYAIGSYLYMKRKVCVSMEIEPGIYVCDDVQSPFILGVVRPKIYLPAGLDARSREYILAHECAHIGRLDHIWKPLGFLLLSIHWFNPLVWIAFILLSRDIELACDEKVVSQLSPEGKATYSDTLLAFSRPHKSIMSCPVAFGEVGVKERVKAVLGYKKPALWIVLVALIVGAALSVCFLTAPKPAKSAKVANAEALQREPSLPLPKKLTGYSASTETDKEGSTELMTLIMCVNQQCEKDE